MNTPTEYRRRLPHIQPDDAVYFVTFRLKGSLPAEIVERLSEKTKTQNNSPKARKEYYESIECLLDNPENGPVWLKNPDIARVIAESFHFYNSLSFRLVCYCIMSNHVHFIGYNFKNQLNQFMKGLKSFTALEANRILNRKGSFWQREYFDRIIRDKNDLDRKIRYVLNNPVNAGLVAHWKDWPFSYCDARFLEV